MTRMVVCIGILLCIVAAIRAGLHLALDALGFWQYMALCGGLCVVMLIAAFGWDYYAADQQRRAPREPQ
jgi:hypothetical protein